MVDLQQSCCLTCAAYTTDKSFDDSDQDADDDGVLRHSLGSHPISGKSLQRALCARRWRRQPCGHFTCCPEAASISCERCELVKYCSVQCMQEHHQSHRQLCESHILCKTTSPFRRSCDPNLLPDTPITRLAHLPTLSNPSNFPVYGLLENAGDDFKRLESQLSSSSLFHELLPSSYGASTALPDHLRFLFPCTYDLRNVLQTVCQVPDDYRGRVTIFINSATSIMAVRDLLILELLRFYGCKGIDMAIALWYSTALTPQQDRAMLLAIHRILYGNQSEADSNRGAKTICSYQSSFPSNSGSRSFFRADYSSDARGILVGMLKAFDATFEPRTQYWERTEETDDINLKRLYALPAHLASWNKYHTRGLLLPFDTLETQFTVPNRLRYCRSLNFITRYSNDVLSGWDILNVISSGVRYGASDQDVYGCLFFHVRKKMQTVLQKLKGGCIFELRLTQFSPKKLADILHRAEISFHRIDACSLAHDSTIDSHHGSQDVGVMSLPAGVHALLKKLSMLIGKTLVQSKPRHFTLPETLQILGRLVEKDTSEEFPRLLFTAMVDWAIKVPSAMKFIQEKESEFKARQADLQRDLYKCSQWWIGPEGKMIYSAQLTQPDDEKYITALSYLCSPARALMCVDEEETGFTFHTYHFLPYLNRLVETEEILKTGLINKTNTGLYRILPANLNDLMSWRMFLHCASNVADQAIGVDEFEQAMDRIGSVEFYYTVLFSGFRFLEEFQEWGWVGR